MRSLLPVVTAWMLAAGLLHAQAPTGHEHPAPASSSEVPPPKPEMFLRLGDDGKRVHIVLISAYNGVNYGMNFDGFAKGQARFTVPVGAEIEVAFTNRSPVPHSVVVVERPQVKRLQMGEPAFTGASTPSPIRGTTGTKGETFRFKASEAGEYAFACGFPSHAANGHWIALDVSEKATGPSLQLAEGAVYSPASKP